MQLSKEVLCDLIDVDEDVWKHDDWKEVFLIFHNNPTFENAINIYQYKINNFDNDIWDKGSFFTWFEDPSQELINYVKLMES
jgi:hypothetical protein